MTAIHLISRLSQIERKPSEIWSAINKYYGDDFLIEQIEEEYGITSQASEKLKKSMED